MNFAEIQSAVTANPALLGEIASGLGKDLLPVLTSNEEMVKGLLPSLTSKGFVVRSVDEEKSFLSSYMQRQDVREGIVSPAIKELHDKYDNDLFELTGKRKGPHEKTYDFLKNIITDLKNSKINDSVLKEQLTTLQRQLEDKEKTHKKAVDDIENKYFSREIDFMVSSALDKVKIAIPSHLKTDQEKQAYVSSQKSMMKRDFLSVNTPKKDNDGNVVYYEGDTQLISNTDGKPLSAGDIIQKRYGFYLTQEDNRSQGGGGTGGAGGGSSVFQSKEEVYNHLVSKGLKPLSKVFNDEYAKIIKEQNIIK